MLSSPAAKAQATRSINVWVDTLRLNVCEDNSQFNIPVWIDTLQVEDSVFAITTVVQWDRSVFDLDTRILANGTLAAQAPDRNVQKNPDGEGEMVVQMGNVNLSGVIAGGGPLFYLIGRSVADDTVEIPNGWIIVTYISLEADTQFEPEFSPGYVQVVRDTVPAYTGTIGVSNAALDTLRTDTVEIALQNVRNRGVNQIAFTVIADTNFYTFIDTLEAGTLASEGLWSAKQVNISADSITAMFTADADLDRNGTLLKLVVQRTTDSAFISPLAVTDFGVNPGSCLGKLVRVDGLVTAAEIIKDSVPVGVERSPQPTESNLGVITRSGSAVIRVLTGGWQVASIEVYDVIGRRIEIEHVESIGPESLLVHTSSVLPAGIYFLMLRDARQIVCKQFIVI
jgi:hypothetical protein